MLAIFRDATDDRPYPLARDARVECKRGAYHETCEVLCQMVLQVRDVLHCPICVNMRVTPVPSTLEAEYREVFVESIH